MSAVPDGEALPSYTGIAFIDLLFNTLERASIPPFWAPGFILRN